ncbi:FlaA1/EpsC-like NDP-sugar epimerase [Sporomusaceae bacterium BoRhaA]|uniref:hypothetical protein n=1 Tax=Pelorhabdus rhamnosifermentans TaxID=2772457 RepID=UPI001C063C52|nr:hypothetical protein [Pelorhabdus rhamnosifermentans]MBU2703625.1 FlaA1/EpsC-like NDP-sugar epimerase [Pelorhabdus rhamnosifermentans]
MNLAKFRINILIILCQVMVLIGLALKGHFDYVHNVLITAGIWLIYMFLEARYKLYMNNFVRVAVGITILSDSFFGFYLDMYLRSPGFDRILHIFGIYSLSLFTYILVVQFLENTLSRLFKFIFVLCLGISIGVVNEIMEFLSDTLSHLPIPNQIGLLDTDLDLLSNVIGAFYAAIHATYWNFVNRNF